jgi:hypothetical protein
VLLWVDFRIAPPSRVARQNALWLSRRQDDDLDARADQGAAKLIHRNAGVEVAGIVSRVATGHPCGGIKPNKAYGEELMSVAQQALLLTGELFVLSFVAIFAFWFADKLRRNFTGKV